MKRTLVYYTDSRLEPELDSLVRKQIRESSNGHRIISVSQKPLDLGDNICVGLKPRSYLGLYKQLLKGLQEVDDDSLVYLCEHDVFYHPAQFRFIPPSRDHIFFNLNRYYWQRNAKFFLHATGKRALSQCVSHKKVLLDYVKEQVRLRVENKPCPNVGPFSNFVCDFPNVDIRHHGNFSAMGRFDISEKSKRVLEIPYWGTPRMFQEKTGYRNQIIDTAATLHHSYNLGFDPNPVILKHLVRRNIPILFKLLNFKRGAEIGVKRGDFSEIICGEVPGVELKCIDHYPPTPTCYWDDAEKFFGMAQEKLKPYDVEHIKKSSMQAADEDVPDGSLDFVYIDGDHTFDHVMQDIIVWGQKVRLGGIISGHDYDITDVRDAVDLYTQRHGCELFVTSTRKHYPDSSPSWFFAKAKSRE